MDSPKINCDLYEEYCPPTDIYEVFSTQSIQEHPSFNCNDFASEPVVDKKPVPDDSQINGAKALKTPLKTLERKRLVREDVPTKRVI